MVAAQRKGRVKDAQPDVLATLGNIDEKLRDLPPAVPGNYLNTQEVDYLFINWENRGVDLCFSIPDWG
jgi:hypothetical protein